MSDYTPTTDEVRDRYAWGRSDVGYVSYDEAEAEFDLWLVAHDATVRDVHEKAVRERIVRAIEARANQEERKDYTPHSSGVFDGLVYAARIVREGA